MVNEINYDGREDIVNEIDHDGRGGMVDEIDHYGWHGRRRMVNGADQEGNVGRSRHSGMRGSLLSRGRESLATADGHVVM
jgi:hypothetical protein